MSKTIRLNKGLDIKLKGKAEKVFTKGQLAKSYAVKPTDFPGLTPKVTVKVGDEVKAGTTLFTDKYQQDVCFASPVSGIVSEVRRGDRRKLLEVVVEPSEEQIFETFEVGDVTTMSREAILSVILKSGAFPFFIQRPYGTVANPNDKPRDIFISGFDTAPLAPDMDFALTGEAEAFQHGVNVLRKLTEGKVYLSLPTEMSATSIMRNVKGVEMHTFSGAHPAGNVGIQIHHIAPINKGDVVWTIAPYHIVSLGRLFSKGIYDVSRLVAVTGSKVKKQTYVKNFAGAALSSYNDYFHSGDDVRYISGNVLTGTRLELNGHMGFHHNQLTVIPEGDYFEFVGWAKPFRTKKFSVSHAYFSWLMPNKEYSLDTNLNGGHRTLVMTGQYEKVLPMDILPTYLLKAIIAEDIDRMEQLGIYEVVEEDLALCEFICPSKTDVQQIIRNGLELLRKEMC